MALVKAEGGTPNRVPTTSAAPSSPPPNTLTQKGQGPLSRLALRDGRARRTPPPPPPPEEAKGRGLSVDHAVHPVAQPLQTGPVCVLFVAACGRHAQGGGGGHRPWPAPPGAASTGMALASPQDGRRRRLPCRLVRGVARGLRASSFPEAEVEEGLMSVWSRPGMQGHPRTTPSPLWPLCVRGWGGWVGRWGGPNVPPPPNKIPPVRAAHSRRLGLPGLSSHQTSRPLLRPPSRMDTTNHGHREAPASSLTHPTRRGGGNGAHGPQRSLERVETPNPHHCRHAYLS